MPKNTLSEIAARLHGPTIMPIFVAFIEDVFKCRAISFLLQTSLPDPTHAEERT